MTKLMMLLMTTIMLMWIQQTEPCLILTAGPIIRFKEIRRKIKEHAKIVEEIDKKQELYE